jgi:hypothetical protein
MENVYREIPLSFIAYDVPNCTKEFTPSIVTDVLRKLLAMVGLPLSSAGDAHRVMIVFEMLSTLTQRVTATPHSTLSKATSANLPNAKHVYPLQGNAPLREMCAVSRLVQSSGILPAAAAWTPHGARLEQRDCQRNWCGLWHISNRSVCGGGSNTNWILTLSF